MTIPNQDPALAADLAAAIAIGRVIARDFPAAAGEGWREWAYRLHTALKNIITRLDNAPTRVADDGSFCYPPRDHWVMLSALDDAIKYAQREGNGFAEATYRAMAARLGG